MSQAVAKLGEEIVKEAKAEAERRLAKAEEEAGKILEAARAEAEKLVEEAKAKAKEKKIKIGSDEWKKFWADYLKKKLDEVEVKYSLLK